MLRVFAGGVSTEGVGDLHEPLVRVNLKLFGQALPLRRNPALSVVKLSRDSASVFPAAKRRKSLFSRGLRVERCTEGWSLPPIREFISGRWA
jgi:hypothetical protein